MAAYHGRGIMQHHYLLWEGSCNAVFGGFCSCFFKLIFITSDKKLFANQMKLVKDLKVDATVYWIV